MIGAEEVSNARNYRGKIRQKFLNSEVRLRAPKQLQPAGSGAENHQQFRMIVDDNISLGSV